jgi:hypothetical protein
VGEREASVTDPRCDDDDDLREDDGNLDLNGKGLVLTLLEELDQPGSTVEEETGGGIL